MLDVENAARVLCDGALVMIATALCLSDAGFTTLRSRVTVPGMSSGAIPAVLYFS